MQSRFVTRIPLHRFCSRATTLAAPVKKALPELSSLRVEWQPQSPTGEFLDSKMRMRVAVTDLNLSPVETEFLEVLAGPRVTKGTLQLISRLDGDFDTNEQRIVEMLDMLIAESKALAAEHPSGLDALE
eukprot:TRINITY_DN27631_c0_g1_i1.p1 TRINITY_DN27631_c0_g1~~TRINITY_DN27631_c0_g1_i1.p1  ORF type:complete len:129 (+),score=36.71 TRINITY_DN27631_c0_g1_i1:237-623(+)